MKGKNQISAAVNGINQASERFILNTGVRFDADTLRSRLFTEAECAYRDQIADGGIFVGDRWFAKDSSLINRTEYMTKYQHRLDRNRRRRERRQATSAAKPRPPRRTIPSDAESQRLHRLPLERRKSLRRTTLAACPLPNEIRTAWHFRNTSREALVRLGGMLLDLECYVDNSLITVVRRCKRRIIGRRGGLKEWIRMNCPELEANYKTLQRIKGVAKRLRQSVGIMDPIPVSVLMDTGVTLDRISDNDIQIQPRIDEREKDTYGNPPPVRNRFAWEKSEPILDAGGRIYFHNDNYWHVNYVNREVSGEKLRQIRIEFKNAISLIGKEKCTIETYSNPSSCGSGVRIGYGVKSGTVEWSSGMLLDEGKDMIKNLIEGLKETAEEVILPRRTLERRQCGGRTSALRFVADAIEGYMDFYEQFLIYRWFRCYG